MNRFTRSLLLATAVAISSPAQAGYLTGYAGWFDFIDDEETSAQFGVEYRFNPIEYGFRPTVGFNVTTDGSTYGYGGFHWDIELLDNELFIIPNFAAGVYGEGDGKDLGGAIEFRSGIEIAYQLPNTHRIGVALNHVSNASIYDKNPGAETLLINYGIPLNF